MTFIINADDAGISMGVNGAIKKMVLAGNLNSVSIMTNGIYVEDIINFCKENQVLCGLHLNLTTGKSTLGNDKLPSITNKDGAFKHGFLGLFLAVFISALFGRSKVLHEIQSEIEAQIAFLKKSGLKIEHINGHRHIHFLPKIFPIVQKIAKEQGILHVRIINESIVQTVLATGFKTLFSSAVIKWFILRFCGFVNGAGTSDTYFFSIFHTCKINNDVAKKIVIPSKFQRIEIMIHPGNSSVDKQDLSLKYELKHLHSKHRDIEAGLNFQHFKLSK